MSRAFRAAGGVTHRAAQVTRIGHFDERKAGMLLVVGAEAAIVRATPLDGSVVHHGHFGFLDEHFAAAAVIVNVIGDEHALGTVLRAALE